MTVEFKFAPLQLVTVTAFNLNLEGRVNRCIHDGQLTQPNMYRVEFACDGKIESREFYEDELTERKVKPCG